jgi:Undecaprenyl-phosphate galactose phosphotransferase WbaP
MKPTVFLRDESFFNKDHPPRSNISRRELMTSWMVLSDLLCIALSAYLAITVWRQQIFLVFFSISRPSLIPIGFAGFILIYSFMGLYPGIGVGPVEELRKLTISSCLMMLIVVTISFYLGATDPLSQAILGLIWLLILISVPLSRKIFRRAALKMGMWGMPAIIIGNEESALAIYIKLLKHPLNGLRPVLCITPATITKMLSNQDKPSAEMQEKGLFKGIEVAIIVPGHDAYSSAKNILANTSHRFKRIIVMFDIDNLSNVWFTPFHIVEQFGLEVVHNLLNPLQQKIKRVLDLFLILIAFPFLVMLILLISIVIKIDSPGSVFFAQKRIGHRGKEFWIWKFRSMTSNSEESLPVQLNQDARLKQEWEQSFKLKKDPRVTRIGYLLRSTSLDELPQIWNVIRGEMSLIGPRPIVREELPLYGKDFELYEQILPGITGMWQISGRNDLPYQERVALDIYYIQNWSIWMDIHILMHTVLAVLLRRGAY